jgi:hypothetical protein
LKRQINTLSDLILPPAKNMGFTVYTHSSSGDEMMVVVLGSNIKNIVFMENNLFLRAKRFSDMLYCWFSPPTKKASLKEL